MELLVDAGNTSPKPVVEMFEEPVRKAAAKQPARRTPRKAAAKAQKSGGGV